MTSETIDTATLVTRFEARIDQFEREMKKAERQADRSARRVERSVSKAARDTETAFTAMGAAASRAFAPLAVAAASTALVKTAKNALQAADDLADMADKAGVSVERFQALTFAGKQLGPSVDVLQRALAKLSAQLGEVASMGTGTAKTAFEALGIALRDSSGNVRTTEAVFDDVMAAIDGLGSTAEKNAALVKIFGERAGPQMGLLLAKGVRGLRDLEQAARDLGIVIAEDTIRQSAALNDEFDKMAEVVGTSVTNAFMRAAIAMARFIGLTAGMSETDLTVGIDEMAEKIEGLRSAMEGESDPMARSFIDNEISAAQGRLNDLKAELAKIKALAEPIAPRPVGLGGGGGGGSRKRSAVASKEEDPAKVVSREALAILRRADSIANEAGMLDMAIPLQARYRAEFEAIANLQEKGIGITDEYRAQIEAAAVDLQNATAMMEEYKAQQEALNKAKEEAVRRERDAAQAAVDGIEGVGDALTGLIGKTQTWEQALVRVAEVLVSIYSRPGGSTFFGDLFSGLSGAIGGLFGGGLNAGAAISAAGGSMFPSFTPARAMGGPASAGHLYRVNERGTEYFRPAVSGDVIPISGGPRSAAPAGPVHVDNRVIVQGDVSERNIALIRAAQMDTERRIRAQVPGIVRDHERRAG